MKEIIVAMDFSKCAMNALSYAVVLANAIEANITIVWVDKPTPADSIFDNSLGIYRKEVHKRFEEIIKKYSKGLTKGTMRYKIRSGKVYDEINNQAKYNDANYIVAGTHGISGFEEFWIGSNSNRIVSSSPCPVFTIRQGFVVDKKINKIILPIDSTNETRQKAPYAVDIAKAFNAEIIVLELHGSSVSAIKTRIENYAKQMVEYLEKSKVKHSIANVKASNLTSATLAFAEENKADLIVIMTEQESTTANIFLGPFAQQMVNHSPIPVLSVHPKNFYVTVR
jgi:nucleotide-binding universal stress UspA family protein